MKKTEKIEIRLSHEEKASLSKLAEEEGRSISDLVRGLIDRYMSLHQDALPRKTRWGLLSAIGIGGVLLGHLGTYFMVQSHSHLEIYQLQAQIGHSRINVPITRSEGEISQFIIPHEAGNIILKANVREGEASLSVVDVSLCQMKDDSCETIATPKLSFNSTRVSSIDFQAGDNRVSLSLSPPLKSSNN